LYYAIKGGKLDVVEFLLQNGSNINNVDKKGQTPMQWAKRFNKQPVIELMVKYGAQPPADPKAQKQAAKKQPPPVKQKVNERKIPKRYMLTVLRGDYYEPISEEEYEKFKAEHPDLALYFEDETAIESLPVPEVPEQA
jgi:ankyrin repeat protein